MKNAAGVPFESVSADEFLAIEQAMSRAQAIRGPAPPPAAPAGLLPNFSPHARPASAAPSAAPAGRVEVATRPSSAPTKHQAPVNLSLWDKHRFMISDYPTPLTSFLKDFRGSVCSELNGNRVYHFPLKDYAAFLDGVRQRGYGVVHELPRFVVELFCCAPKVPPAEFDPASIPQKLAESLFPFQREGVEFIVRKNGRGLIGDEMGLGKTIQAIAIAYYYRTEWPVLIVCPSSLRDGWAEQIERWLPSEAGGINIVRSSRGNVRGAINIVSYALASKFMNQIEERDFQVAIVDESHYLKNSRTKRTQSLLPFLQRTKRCVLLSGTPAVSRPQELFCQIQALSPSLFPYFNVYGNRYCNPIHKPWGTDYNGSSNPRELNSILSTMMIRRKKDDVLSQLPPKTRQKVLVHVKKEHMKALDKQMMDMASAKDERSFAETRKDFREAQFVSQAVFFELFRNTGRAKLPAVTEYILELLEGSDVGPKVLIFAHHVDVMDGISHALEKAKVKFIRIDGSTDVNKRQGLANLFQEDPTHRAAVLSIGAAGVGLTLTAASLVLFAELYYNPGAILQAEDRAHRIGQESNVCVRYLVARNTVDEQLFKLLDRKFRVLGETLDGVSGKRFDMAGGEINRESVHSSSDNDSFLVELLKMIHAAAGAEPAAKKQKDDDYEEEDEKPAEEEKEIQVQEVIQKAQQATGQFQSKLSKFAFGK